MLTGSGNIQFVLTCHRMGRFVGASHSNGKRHVATSPWERVRYTPRLDSESGSARLIPHLLNVGMKAPSG